jgi:putative ABC transport system permease protein
MANVNLTVWDTTFGFYTYILLHQNASALALEAKFPVMARKYLTQAMDKADEYDKWLAAGNEYRYFLQPLTSIHLHSNLKWEIEPNGDITYIYLFGAIGGFILFIACINFMNLATARSMNRAKEVSVRKVVGSQRRQLISQFLFEAILLSAMAMVVAIFLAELALPAFDQLLGKSLALNYAEDKKILAALISFAIFVGVIAGSYPAFFLSSFRPVAVLKGTLLQGAKKNNFRNVLVVAQFAISIIMIVGTAVVFRQMNFMSNKKLGFDKEHVVVIHRAWPLASKAENFKQELLKEANIVKAAVSGNSPGLIQGAGTYRPKDRPDEISLNMAMLGGDGDIIETMGMELVAGRNFRPGDLTDTTRYVILNETAVKQFGWTDDPIGKQLLGSQNDRPVFQIIGVVKDFHFESLHKEIRPLIYFLAPDWVGAVSVRINPTDIPGTLAYLEKKWKEFVPNAVFDFSFLDEDLQALYQTEQTTGKLFVVFSAMAIFVACLGLFGLASFTTEQRTKEIGIRKVLGASVGGLVGLLSQDFVKLVLLANIFAWPLAYFAMNKWLQDFAYRIDIGWWIFALAGGMALVIALLTVSFQAIKAALANPVEALRYE